MDPIGTDCFSADRFSLSSVEDICKAKKKKYVFDCMHYTPYDKQNYEIHSITAKPLNDDDGSSRKPNYKDISQRWRSG